MTYSVLKKFISVFLAFSILNVNIFALDFDLQQFAPLRHEITQTIKPITDSDIRAKYRKEYNFKNLLKSINEQGQNNKYGQVCDGDFCAPYHTFMRGLIGALIDFSEGDGTIFINYTKEIRNAAFMGALASKDIKPLRELLKDGAKETLDDCGTNPFFEGVEETANTVIENLYIKKRDFSADRKAQDNCEKGLAGLSILSVVWDNKQQADETADLIYKALKKHYKGKFSSLVLLEGIAALSFIDTDYSYQLIEEFLTKDTIPSRVGTAVLDTFSMFLPQGIYDAGEKEIEEKYNNATRYLNRINARWQYIDEAATKERGIDPSIFKQANSAAGQFDDNYNRAAYNAVYNNTLTDIGAFLSAQGERGQKLAKKIVRKYALATTEEREQMHTPLILGLIQNLEFADALPAARIINESFYYDIGGGVGSLIAEKSAIKSSGLSKHAENTISEKYYLTRAKIGRGNFILGLFVQVISMGFLALSITNAVANIYSLASFRSLKFTVNMGGAANAGRTAQIAQTGKAAQIAQSTKPVQSLSQAAPALVQSKITTPALSQPKAPVVESLGASNVLSKVRNSKAQMSFTPKQKPLAEVSGTVSATGKRPRISPVPSASTRGGMGDSPFYLRKSVFKIAGWDNYFTGYLWELPGTSEQFIITAGHGVSEYPEKKVQLFDYLGKPVTEASVFFYRHNNNIDANYYDDFALLSPHKHIDAPALNLAFDGLSNYKNFTTISFPRKKFEYKPRTLGVLDSGEDPGNVEFLDEGAMDGESGSPVIAETAPGKYRVVGTIVANYWDKLTIVQNLNWLQAFLRGELEISNLLGSKEAFWPGQPETPSQLKNLPVTHVDFINPYKGGPVKSTTASYKEPASSVFFPDTAPLVSSANAKIFSEVVSAELMPYDESVHHSRAVWKLKDRDGNILFYLKYGTAEEIAATKRVHEVVSNNTLIKNNPLVKLNYPLIVAEGDIPLPSAIKSQIKKELRQIKSGLWGVGRGEVPFVMTPLKLDGFNYADLSEPGGKTLAKHKLHNKPITLVEWEQVEKIFEELNKNGIVHEDLLRNEIWGRDYSDVLNTDIIDWENGPKKVKDNKEDLQNIRKRFERYGIKESNIPNSNINSQYFGSQYWF